MFSYAGSSPFATENSAGKFVILYNGSPPLAQNSQVILVEKHPITLPLLFRLHEKFGQDPAMFEYSGWNPYATPEMAAKTVAEFIAGYDDPHSYAWAIEHDGKLAGTIGAYDYDTANSSIEVGMSIEKESWGRGFATEALSAVLRYLVEDEQIVTVTAWCASDNIGSQRAMDKAGMVKVREAKGALTIGDATFDRLDYEFCGSCDR